jgi:hypothetical protein
MVSTGVNVAPRFTGISADDSHSTLGAAHSRYAIAQPSGSPVLPPDFIAPQLPTLAPEGPTGRVC